MTQPKRILVIRNSAMGDVAMTLPILYSVSRQYPDTDFYLLTRPFFARMFIGRPSNLHIIEADYRGRYKGLAGILRCVSDLSKFRFDAVADLHNVLRSWIIDLSMRLCGVPVAIVDKQRSRRGAAKRVAQLPYLQRYTDVFARLGYPVTPDFVSVFGDAKPEPHFAVRHPAVGIAPFARYATKTYPPELMQKVVAKLLGQGVQVWLYGAKGREGEILASWEQLMPGCRSLAGKLDIEQELAMMANMDVMVAMDSANHHLASLVGVQAISIWGGTTPACGFMAYGQSSANALVAGLECQPCSTAGTETCPLGTLSCMSLLQPDRIVSRIMSMINK